MTNKRTSGEPLIITVLGDLLWDVFIPSSDSTIPPPDSAIHLNTNNSFGLYPGGMANLVASLQASGISKHSIHFIASVGDDHAGQALIDNASRFSVVHATIIPGIATGFVICYLHENGDRGMLVSPGASARIQPRHLPYEILQKSKVFYAPGFYLINKNKQETLIKALQSIPSHCVVAFDPGAARIIKEHQQFIEELLSTRIDVFLPNENEFCTLMKCNEVSMSTLSEFFARFPRVEVISVTLGENGAATMSRTSSRLIKLPARKVKPVDTTGAGDTYAGSFLGTFLMKKDLHLATKVGIEMSSRCIQFIGGHEYLNH